MNGSPLEDRRVWIGGGVLVAVLLVAVSWLMLIGPKFDSASNLQSQTDDTDSANQLIAAKNDKLQRDSRQLDTLQNKLRAALDGLPADSGLAAFTTEATSLASQNRVTLSSISISTPTNQQQSIGTTSTPALPSTGASGAAVANSATGSAGGVVSVNVTLTTSGTGTRQDAFLTSLQNGPRRVLVTSTQLSVAASSRVNSVDSVTTMTTQLTIFSAPMSDAQRKTVEHDLAAG